MNGFESMQPSAQPPPTTILQRVRPSNQWGGAAPTAMMMTTHERTVTTPLQQQQQQQPNQTTGFWGAGGGRNSNADNNAVAGGRMKRFVDIETQTDTPPTLVSTGCGPDDATIAVRESTMNRQSTTGIHNTFLIMQIGVCVCRQWWR